MAKINNCSEHKSHMPGELSLYEALEKSSIPDGWEVYFQPRMNGLFPDFVLINERVGAIVIEVKDYNLSLSSYASGGYKTEKGKIVGNPVIQVESYAQHIIDNCCYESYISLKLKEPKAFAIIEKVLFFYGVTRGQAKDFCGDCKNVTIIVDEDLKHIIEGDFNKTGIKLLKYSQTKFDKLLVAKFIKDLRGHILPTEYSKERTERIKLSKKQGDYSLPVPGHHRRMTGVAGSGKSVILATLAANLMKTRKNVLILTFNITLANYLRDLVRQQAEYRNDKTFTVLHYHSFITQCGYNFGLYVSDKPTQKTNEGDKRLLDSMTRLVYDCKEPIRSKYIYDAILIDEGQDFEMLWVQTTLKFLCKNGQLLVVYDRAQNIYDRELVWLDKGTEGLGFRGNPVQLKETWRLPEKMIDFINRFCEEYKILSRIEYPAQLSIEGVGETEITWLNTTDDKTNIEVLNQINYLKDNNIHANDITILVFDKLSGFKIFKFLETEKYSSTHIFCEQMRQCGNDRYHCKSSDCRHMQKCGEQQYSEERWRKLCFYGNSSYLKICTVHSYKGWESNHLIILLNNENIRPNLFLVAVTRLKSNLIGKKTTCLVVNTTKKYENLTSLPAFSTDTTILGNKMSRVVHNLHGLTDEEIKIVEGAC